MRILSRFYGQCLVGEFAVILAVMAIFRVIESRIVAGAVAGTCFVSLGVFIFQAGLRDSRVRRSPTFWVGSLHLFLSALPLMITRLLNQGTEFKALDVMGLPGPVFHRLSTGLFLVLLLATIFDLWRARRAKSVAV